MAGRPTPRPKRDSEAFARTHDQDTDERSSKKPRFDYRNPSTLAPDAPEEDSILDLDEIGKSRGAKRNAVQIDGFNSDSDPDDFETRKKKDANGHVDDIFADLDKPDGEDDDEELQREGKGKKKIRFLEEDEIEGQEEESKAGGHVSADFSLNGGGKKTEVVESSSESSDDEERDRLGPGMDAELGAGSKKKHVPRLDAFNMKTEHEEGRFDEQGNFVRKGHDPDAVHDSWLNGISKKEIKRAARMHELREEERLEKEREDAAVPTSKHLATLIEHLRKLETVLEALARHNKAKPKQKSKKRNKHQSGDAIDEDPKPEDDAAEKKRKAAIEAITEAADQLLSRGMTDVYDTERESFTRLYQRSTGNQWEDTPDSEDQQWEFRWVDARDGGITNGPFTSLQLKEWYDAGYFETGVEYRRVGDTEWLRTADFL
jgi:CD2 antigen cytoplasmic tail-binding protein 2